MDMLQKLRLLSEHMDVEQDDDNIKTTCNKVLAIDKIYLSHAIMPNGKKLRLLKTALSSACENNCYYCAFRAGRDFRRITFVPDELAQSFMSLYNAGIVQGFFISSGIVNGGINTQDRLIEVAEILRNKLGFRGYIHLKIMPGAEFDQIYRTMQLANRVSINLEAPNAKRLSLIAPRKSFTEQLMPPIQWINEIRQSSDPYYGWNHNWPSSSTQFVVGAAGENDEELLSTTDMLYHHYGVKRAYFSKFKPISDTPLEGNTFESPLRELRLYQASFLLRDYGFKLVEIPFDINGNIPSNEDPKYYWAKNNLTNSPLEINQAGKQELLRLPGVGPKYAQSILEKRRIHKITCLEDLKNIGINTNKIARFVLLNGKRPPYQPSFISFD